MSKATDSDEPWTEAPSNIGLDGRRVRTSPSARTKNGSCSDRPTRNLGYATVMPRMPEGVKPEVASSSVSASKLGSSGAQSTCDGQADNIDREWKWKYMFWRPAPSQKCSLMRKAAASSMTMRSEPLMLMLE